MSHRITNAVSEGLSFKIQAIKKMAYSFRKKARVKTAVYFRCGGVDLYVRYLRENRLKNERS